RDVLDRVRHVADRDADEALGDLLQALVLAGLLLQLRKSLSHDGSVEREIAAFAEYLGEILRLDLAEHDVRVGHGRRPAAAVARRPGIGAGRVGADAVARAVEAQDRAAAGGHRVDAHHRRAHAHAGYPRLELALELPGVVGDVGGRP